MPNDFHNSSFSSPRREERATHSTHSFVEEITNAVARGYGFVPLIGAGFSVASGIPVADGFRDMLLPYVKDAAEGKWSPEHGFHLVKQYEAMPAAPKRMQLLMKWARAVTSKDNDERARQLRLEAIGTYPDWRSMLRFLSRIGRDSDGKPMLIAPDPTLTDLFFKKVTDGRQPNLAHNLLGHLADGLRIHTILTTNFDDLLEQAFERLRMPLQCFDVHLNAGLPASKIVMGARSLIKLHGGRYGLRADVSLDELPTLSDQWAFVDYFRRPELPKGDPAATLKHALVMGVSGRDRRTISLLAKAMVDLKDLQVFWTHYDRKESVTVELEYVAAQLGISKDDVTTFADRVHELEVLDPGLFLFELYQRLHHALPPSGVSYSGIARVPGYAAGHAPGAKSKSDGGYDYAKILHPGLLERNANRLVEQCGSPFSEKPPSRIIAVSGADGVTLAASEAFWKLYTRYTCIWFDLSQYRQPADFRMTLLEAVAIKVGRGHEISQLPHDISAADFRACLHDFAKESSRPILVFVNGREPLGSCCGWYDHNINNRSAATSDAFWACFNALVEGGQSHLRLVVLYRPTDQRALSSPPSNFSACSKPVELSIACLLTNTEEIVSAVLAWLQKEDSKETRDRKVRFVYALTLFRRSRPHAALSSWALLRAPNRWHADASADDNDAQRAKEGAGWLEILEEYGVVRFKAGGFVWIYNDVRERLQLEIQTKPDWREITDGRAICHQGIADWYAKLFRSSNDPQAAVESLYHRFCAIRFAKTKTSPGKADLEPQELTRTSLQEALHILGIARNAILSRGHLDNAKELPKAVCALRNGINGPGCESRPLMARFSKQLLWQCRDLLECLYRRSTNYKAAIAQGKILHGLGAEPRESRLSGDELSDAMQHYRQAVCYTGLRQYEDAHKRFRELFKALEADSLLKGEDIDSMRQSAAKWSGNLAIGEDKIKLGIRASGRYMFLLLLEAQTVRLNEDVGAARMLFRQAEAVYTMATTLLRYAADVEFINRHNVYVRTLYGVLLGNLECFLEANRRFNEAAAYLALQPFQKSSTAWAVIDLRRAEVYLRHAEKIRPELEKRDAEFLMISDASSLLCLSLLDDAEAALERAQRFLISHREYVWWWALLYELKLRAYCYRAKLMGPSSRDLRIPMDVSCADAWLASGSRLARHDVFRLARLVHLYGQIPNKFRLRNSGVFKGVCTQLSETLIHRPGQIHSQDERILHYAREVLKLSEPTNR